MTVVASKFERQENDLYETEAWATRAFCRYFPVAGMKLWEPAAGGHKMADVLREFGGSVITSDIAYYGREHDHMLDFLRDPRPVDLGSVDGIVTNPPYGPRNILATRFVEQALAHCPGLVAMLLTAKFDSGKTRSHLFANNHRFVGKIVLTDRIQWFESDTDGTEDHAWFIWQSERSLPFPSLFYASSDL